MIFRTKKTGKAKGRFNEGFVERNAVFLSAAVIGSSFVLRMSLAGMELGDDEAHYALYGLFPDWSFFDHPPMVGWLASAGLLLGEGEIPLRLPAMILWTLSLVLVYQCTARWFDGRTALLALLMLTLSPGVQLLSLALIPDAPLVFFLLLALRTVSTPAPLDFKRWVALGFFLGLAGLSKYTAIFPAAALLPALVADGRTDAWRQPGFLLAGGTALLTIAPVIYWNWQNDWASLAFQFSHGTEGRWHWQNALRFLVAVFVSVGLWLVVPSLIGLFSSVGKGLGVKWAKTGAVFTLAAATWSSGNGELLPHWTAPCWFLSAPLAARVVLKTARRWLRCVFALFFSLGVLTCLVLWLAMLLKPVDRFPGLSTGLSAYFGWKEAGRHVETLREALEKERGAPVQLWTESRYEASRLAWYEKKSAKLPPGKPSQFDYWGEPARAPALYVRFFQADVEPPDSSRFGDSDCGLAEIHEHSEREVPISRFAIYLCEP